MQVNKSVFFWWLNRGDEESPAPPGSAPTISELDPDVDMDWQPAGSRTGGGVQSSDATREGHIRPQGGKQESGEDSDGGPGERYSREQIFPTSVLSNASYERCRLS